MDVFEKQQKELEEKRKKDLILGLMQIATGLWAFCVVITAVFVFNSGFSVLHIITGVISVAGAIVATVAMYKKSRENQTNGNKK